VREENGKRERERERERKRGGGATHLLQVADRLIHDGGEVVGHVALRDSQRERLQPDRRLPALVLDDVVELRVGAPVGGGDRQLPLRRRLAFGRPRLLHEVRLALLAQPHHLRHVAHAADQAALGGVQEEQLHRHLAAVGAEECGRRRPRSRDEVVQRLPDQVAPPLVAREGDEGRIREDDAPCGCVDHQRRRQLSAAVGDAHHGGDHLSGRRNVCEWAGR